MADRQERPDAAADVAAVMSALRRALDVGLLALGEPVAKAADLVRLVGADTKLASQVMRLARGEKPAAAYASDVPGPRSAGRLVTMFGEAGVPKANVGALAKAFDEFEALIRRHAQSRREFVALATGLAEDAGDDSGEAADDRQRREAFRAHRHLLGRQCEVLHAMFVLHPARRGGRHDVSVAYVVDGLQRLRPQQPLHLVRMFRDVDRPDNVAGGVKHRVEPIDAEHALPPLPGERQKSSASLLPALCSQPLPEIVVEPDSDGVATYRLAGRDVGAASATRVAIAQRIRRLVGLDDDPPEVVFRITPTTPARRLVLDVLLAPPFDAFPMQTRTYMPMAGFGDDSPDHLAAPTVQTLPDLAALATDALPHGQRLARALGAEAAAKFVCRRIEVGHPLLGARTIARTIFSRKT
jgi:hypothetical protein